MIMQIDREIDDPDRQTELINTFYLCYVTQNFLHTKLDFTKKITFNQLNQSFDLL